MNRNTHILNELMELAPALATLNTAPVFMVPEGYFNHLAENIILKINTESSILGNGLNQKPGFTVPEGYFNSLAGNIINRIKTKATENPSAREETAALSPLLAGISREMPFSHPRSYFDRLPERILQENQGAKLVKMSSGRVITKWMKMAAAACIVGLLAMGAYWLVNRGGNSTGTEIANTGRTLEQIKSFDLDSELEKLGNNELGNYLCETGAIACNDIKDEDLSKKLAEITDEDLSSYLEGTN
jgi:hypothetical protein